LPKAFNLPHPLAPSPCAGMWATLISWFIPFNADTFRVKRRNKFKALQGLSSLSREERGDESKTLLFLKKLQTMNKRVNELTAISRELRKNDTLAEKLIWNKLRNRKFLNLKFSRQKPIIYQKSNLFKTKFFIADFFCFEHKLIIEIDGEIHRQQIEYNNQRSFIINDLGYRIIRFSNKEVKGDIEAVLKKLSDFIEKTG
jgi:very-short-patch-repair endonuclease